eukprot:TRINITY_DN24211_c0_g3_i1.p1 TRINITY_DN24211_c0_g3~~TRINITY_DN24211_c0_g3_i1.p1  ORF type:complete len:546 (-),score=49.54 TRINITY_DN24211_c0_g3_i1:61-1698(-)
MRTKVKRGFSFFDYEGYLKVYAGDSVDVLQEGCSDNSEKGWTFATKVENNETSATGWLPSTVLKEASEDQERCIVAGKNVAVLLAAGTTMCLSGEAVSLGDGRSLLPVSWIGETWLMVEDRVVRELNGEEVRSCEATSEAAVEFIEPTPSAAELAALRGQELDSTLDARAGMTEVLEIYPQRVSTEVDALHSWQPREAERTIEDAWDTLPKQLEVSFDSFHPWQNEEAEQEIEALDSSSMQVVAEVDDGNPLQTEEAEPQIEASESSSLQVTAEVEDGNPLQTEESEQTPEVKDSFFERLGSNFTTFHLWTPQRPQRVTEVLEYFPPQVAVVKAWHPRQSQQAERKAKVSHPLLPMSSVTSAEQHIQRPWRAFHEEYLRARSSVPASFTDIQTLHLGDDVLNYTTVILRNVPACCDRDTMVSVIDRAFKDMHDFFFLPYRPDLKNHGGMCLINFRNVLARRFFVQAFNNIPIRFYFPDLSSVSLSEKFEAVKAPLQGKMVHVFLAQQWSRVIGRNVPPGWTPIIIYGAEPLTLIEQPYLGNNLVF